MFSWDASPTDGYWTGRRDDLPAPANPQAWNPGDGYGLGEQWAPAMFELYRKLDGDSATPAVKRAARDLAIRLPLAANARIPGADATITQMAQQIEAADHNLAGWRYPDGLHRKVIYNTFCRRRIPGFPPLPVGVDDSRGGGAGADDGDDDNSQDKFWRESDRNHRDIWTRRAA